MYTVTNKIIFLSNEKNKNVYTVHITVFLCYIYFVHIIIIYIIMYVFGIQKYVFRTWIS